MKDLNTVLTIVAANGVVVYPFIETQTIREASINVLNLGTRAYNALKRNKIDTIGKLLDTIPALDKMRGLGTKSKSNILYELCAFTYASLSNKRKKDYLMRIIELNVKQNIGGRKSEEI